MDWYEVKIPGVTDGVIVRATSPVDAFSKAFERFSESELPVESKQEATCHRHYDSFRAKK